MDSTEPTMTNLFLQLGLDASARGIADFILAHQLDAGVKVTEAPYWSSAQRQFLGEQIKSDAPWALVVDQLNEALHEDAVRAESPVAH
ncbi:MAG: DUF2789 domain-containing protein [Comamonas sp.]